MAIELHGTADAFGKVILFGEHAVVHGYPALAIGLPQSLRLRAEQLPDRHAPIELSIPQWNLDLVLARGVDHLVATAVLEVLAHCDGPSSGWRISGESTLPAGAGLGSSAALTVAVARLALGPGADDEPIIAASMAGERIFHGNPSGIDSEIAARGGALRFVRGKPPEPIAVPNGFELCVVSSGVTRSTADQIAKVRARLERRPALIRPLLELSGRCTAIGIDALARDDRRALGEVMDVAHDLVNALGAGGPILDELCWIARRHGALGAKLTGAGGGGSVVILPPSQPAAMLDAFASKGYQPLAVALT